MSHLHHPQRRILSFLTAAAGTSERDFAATHRSPSRFLPAHLRTYLVTYRPTEPSHHCIDFDHRTTPPLPLWELRDTISTSLMVDLCGPLAAEPYSPLTTSQRGQVWIAHQINTYFVSRLLTAEELCTLLPQEAMTFPSATRQSLSTR
jgi:hypothetical protein